METPTLSFLQFCTLALLLLMAGWAKDIEKEGASQPKSSAEDAALARVRVFATGLNYPRGLKLEPDGNLTEAEGGTRSTHLSALDSCVQVSTPVDPYLGSPTGAHLRNQRGGARSTVTDQLPSSQ